MGPVTSDFSQGAEQSCTMPRKQTKRVLLTGASGLLGRQVLRQLEEAGWEVRGLCSSRCRDRLVSCDLTKTGDVEKQLSDFSPDVVVHMAAERRPDVCHKSPEGAQGINVDATESLAKACQDAGAWLIYVSTDYVFDGTLPPYSVAAAPNPLSEYGQQKLKGECVTLQACPSAAVLRIPLLYGPIEYFKESGVTALYPDLKSGLVKNADHFQKRYPTYTKDVSMVIAEMIKVHAGGKRLQGVFHWQADECLTKFDMVQLIAELEKLDASAVVANTCPPPYPCPKDTCLDCSRLIEELGIDPVHFRTPIHEALRESLAAYVRNTNAAAHPKEESKKNDMICQLPVLCSSMYKEIYCTLKAHIVEEKRETARLVS